LVVSHTEEAITVEPKVAHPALDESWIKNSTELNKNDDYPPHNNNEGDVNISLSNHHGDANMVSK